MRRPTVETRRCIDLIEAYNYVQSKYCPQNTSDVNDLLRGISRLSAAFMNDTFLDIPLSDFRSENAYRYMIDDRADIIEVLDYIIGEFGVDGTELWKICW